MPSSPPNRTNTIPQSQTPKPSKPTTLTRILNYTVFTFLSIILLCLIVLTPADAIYQCYVTSRLTNIFIITGGYVVTFLLAVLIYATRIYTNRSALGGIPKAWIPVEKEDVGKSVRRLVVEGLGRSALVAGAARPRALRGGGHGGEGRLRGQIFSQAPAQARALAEVGEDAADGEEEGLLRGFDFDIDPANPPWGVIEHPGWSAPESSLSMSANAHAHAPQAGPGSGPDSQTLPSLCYRAVIRELPHLIEAKAVSLAPPDPVFIVAQRQHQHQRSSASGSHDEALHLPDTRIVAILRRPGTMSLRSYINHLSSLSILNPPETGLEFLSLYERARFSGRELYEDEFRALMGVFADVLRGMRFDVGEQGHLISADSESHLDGDGDGDADGDRYTFGSRSESVIGPSDEEGETETDTLGSVNVRSPFTYSHDYRSGRPRSGYGQTQTQNQTLEQNQEQEHHDPQASWTTGLDGTITPPRASPTSTTAQVQNRSGFQPQDPDPSQSQSHLHNVNNQASYYSQQTQTQTQPQPLPPPRTPSPPASTRSSRSRPATGASSGMQSHHTYSSLHPVRSSGSGRQSRFVSASTASASASRPGSGSRSRSGSKSGSGSVCESGSGSGSESGGSVIRLADARTESQTGLPYVLDAGGRGGS